MAEDNHIELNTDSCGCTYRYFYDGNKFLRKDLEDFCAKHEKESIEMFKKEKNPLYDPLAQGGP